MSNEVNLDSELSRVLVLERQVADLRADLEKTESLLTKANALVRSMHEAAMGAVTPPRRGWVGDIEDLRVERDVLIQRIMDSKPSALQAKLDDALAERDHLRKLVKEQAKEKDPLAGVLAEPGVEDPATASGICEPDPSRSG